jgi:hypothetical protein
MKEIARFSERWFTFPDDAAAKSVQEYDLEGFGRPTIASLNCTFASQVLVIEE